MKIVIKENKEEIALEVANLIATRIKDNPKLNLGLATGSTPIPTYQELIKIAKKDHLSFKDIITFNLDEYVGLNEDNNQSYRYFMNENLFKHLDFNKDNHYFPLEESYQEYDTLIDNKGGIDIQILGIGANGHIAFNEPNTPLELKTHITKLDERTIKDNSRFFNDIKEVPTSAITMGLSTILKARTIILIATGKNKAEAIKEMNKGIYNPLIPASALNLAKGEVIIYLDKEASILL